MWGFIYINYAYMGRKRMIILVGILVVLVAAGLWFLKGKGVLVSDPNKDPFRNITIPASYASDPATKKVIEDRIAGTKAMYEESPNIWETWIAIGNLKSLLEDYPGAIAAYQKSLEFQSNNMLAYRNIAEVYNTHLQDYEQAANYYRLALNTNFSDSGLYIQLGLIYDKQLQKSDEAEKLYLDGLNKAADNTDIYTTIIKFYKDHGNMEKYKEYAQKLIALHPDNELYKSAYKDALE